MSFFQRKPNLPQYLHQVQSGGSDIRPHLMQRCFRAQCEAIKHLYMKHIVKVRGVTLYTVPCYQVSEGWFYLPLLI